MRCGGLQGRGLTDARGILDVYVHKGTWKADVTHPEFKPHKGESFGVESDATHAVVLERAVRVIGRLTTCDGAPAHGWWVGVRGAGNEGKSVTDGDGRFVINSVSAGPATVGVYWPQFLQTEILSQPIECAEDLPELILRLPPLPTIRGRLRGFRAQDLGACRVRVGSGSITPGFSMSFEAVPDDNGFFELGPMPAGEYSYELEVTTPETSRGFAAAGGRITVAPDRETMLDLECSAPGQVSVEIEILEGTPYERYELVVTPKDGVPNVGWTDVDPGWMGRRSISVASASGEVTIELLGDEDRIEHRTLLKQTVTLEPGGKIALRAKSK